MLFVAPPRRRGEPPSGGHGAAPAAKSGSFARTVGTRHNPCDVELVATTEPVARLAMGRVPLPHVLS